MNFYLLASALRARYRVFLLILGTTLLFATIVSLMMAKSYIATASVLVDSKDGQFMNSSGSAPPERERTGYMQTQLDIFTSPKVARRVVGDLHLADSPDVQASFEDATAGKGSIIDWLAETLEKGLKVDSSQSSIIQASFTSSDPHFSAVAANAFAKAYMDTVLELRVEPSRQNAIWFDEQLKALRSNLEQAQTRLAEFEQAKGIVASDERFDVDNSRLADLSTQVVKAEDETVDASSRDNQAHEPAGRGGSQENLPEVIASPFIQGLKSDLLRGEAKLDELSTQYGVMHPLYRRQEAENESLKHKISTEIGRIVAGLDSSARQSRDREMQLRAAATEQRDRILSMKQDRTQLNILKGDVDSAQKTYDTAMQHFMTSKVESQANLANVSILSAAVDPSRPARPRIALNIGLAAAIGLLLGLAVVYLMEMFDRRVRTLSDLEGDHHIPMLAELNTWQPARERLAGHFDSHHLLPGPG